MPVEIFGRTVGDVTKRSSGTGTTRMGAQDGVFSNPKAKALSTALENVSRQQDMNLQPDPTLGAPFSSFPDNRLTVAQMGPGEPAENFPLGGEPRQWKYRVGWNFPTTPDTDRGINGELLRALADSSWLVRRCIEIRKAELCGLSWEIVAKGHNGKERQRNGEEYQPLINELTSFMEHPEGYYTYENGQWIRRGLVDWGDWLNASMEDYYVGDWWSVWPQRTLGNKMLGLRRVDGMHIKALLDLDGRTPPPPMPAWQQYLYGVPRGSWAADEFYYMPRNLRNMTPYGFSHIQQALVMINQTLKFDQWNTAAYTESTIPMGILEAPENVTPEQIQDIADFLNGAAASLADRMKVHPAPNGTKWQPIKPFEFDQDFAMYVIEGICACFDVQPQELGYAPSRAGLGGAGFAQTQGEIHRRKSLVPTARWIERKLTKIIHDQWKEDGGDMLEFRFSDLVSEDLQAKYTANKVAILSGQKAIDEVLEEDGQDGLGIGHVLETQQGLVFLEKGVVLTATGMVPLTLNSQELQQQQQQQPNAPPGSNPPSAGDETNGGQNPPAPMKAALADIFKDAVTGADDKKKVLEAAWLLAWRKWWKKKLDALKDKQPLRPEEAKRLLELSQAEQNDLAEMLQKELRGPAYESAFVSLVEESGIDLALPSAIVTPSDVLRLQTKSQTHMVEIAQTYHTDLSRAFDQAQAESAGHPDVSAQALMILRALVDWAQKRVDWKGEQIGATEATRAQTQATMDFRIQNPGAFLQYMWWAELDDKTCEKCRARHGSIVGPSDVVPPMHPNCRCKLLPMKTNRETSKSW
ncbi:phage portal protein [Alicyclobacillus sp. ALC3]|uniref:phage portal protein n=1 Tax=Alicyclobacillus sp. ALC3 TaxID=2796143 RepID=UPI002378AFE4|nr:phage portal protein [Alicyclobacillus sp. ALC3]WDL96937.1 phage portal protein [Alicyclobacillus sp. ALC3]